MDWPTDQCDDLIGRVIESLRQVVGGPEAQELVARAVDATAAEDGGGGATRGACRFASRVARRVPVFGAHAEIDELVDHALACQRNHRQPGRAPICGYTHRTMDPVYGDPRYNNIVHCDREGRPLVAFIAVAPGGSAGSIELLVVTPDPDDPEVEAVVGIYREMLSVLHDAPVETSVNITHQAAFFARHRWVPPSCLYGPCRGCNHPYV